MRRPEASVRGTRPDATSRLPAAVVLAMGSAVVLSACAGGGSGPSTVQLAPAPEASPEAPDSADSDREPVQAPEDQCAAVAELQLSLTLLPLADEEGSQGLDLASVAADARSAADGVPAAVEDDFDDAAELLVGYGSALEPHELDELRTSLDPVDVWIGRHCSS